MTSRRFTIYVFSFIVAASVLFAAVKLSLTPQAVTSPLPTNILSKPQTTALPTETFPSVSFSEISGATGIDFKYDSGSLGDFHLTETLGGGLAVFDYNSDGNLDLFFVQGGTLSPRDHPSQSNRLSEIMETGPSEMLQKKPDFKADITDTAARLAIMTTMATLISTFQISEQIAFTGTMETAPSPTSLRLPDLDVTFREPAVLLVILTPMVNSISMLRTI